MRVLQINTVVNSGSTGRIAEEIGNVLLEHGHESYIAYGRGSSKSNSKLIRIGTNIDNYVHGAYTLVTDKHGFASINATKRFLKQLEKIKPDIIGLHNLHGYYINLPLLFDWIKINQVPTLWTLFDCWSFTGHCTYFDDIKCNKWKTNCNKCPKFRNYPSAWLDNSKWNYVNKKQLFTSLNNMQLVTHSNWLFDLVKKSYLSKYNLTVTPSAINLDLFKPTNSNLRQQFKLEKKKILLGCANTWSNRKGYNDFLELNKRIDKDEYKIVMIGLNAKEKENLPNDIIGISRTESLEQLAQWYTLASIFVNPTSQDNFPTTNLEALACGTPVITYDTGGSPESIDKETGIVVNKGDVKGILKAILLIGKKEQNIQSKACIERAKNYYDKKNRYLDYLRIFEKMLQT